MSDELSSVPKVWCPLCKRSRVVTRDGRGFPPDIARRKLSKECKENGCPGNVKALYRAGVSPSLIVGQEG